MKKIVLGSLIFAFAAYAKDPVAQLTFRVRDDFGNAATSAPVVMTTAEGWRPGRTDYGYTELRETKGLTDSNGFVTLNLPCKTGNIRSYSVSGAFDGMNKMEYGGAVYYVDRGGSFLFTNQVMSEWQPWNPTVDIQVKEVINPTPMYARSFINSWPQLQIPELGTPVEFDLMKGDWLAPHGKGEVADLCFTLSVTDLGQRTIDRGPLYDAIFSVTFSKSADGIQSFLNPLGGGSAFRSPRFAPLAGYTNRLIKSSYEHETESRHEKREDQTYFFRVRTRLDEAGNIVEALYGKIYGDIAYSSKGVLRFAYYLNPTPNDRNMEFDPSRNLFTNLPPLEEVRDP